MGRILWVTIFSAVFLLSLDFWVWGDGPASGPLGIPWWVYYFGALQFILAAALIGFSRSYWASRERADDEAEDPGR